MITNESHIYLDKVQDLLRHIQNVQQNCFLLASRFIERGDHEFGKMLIANAQKHDNSKWFGIEFDVIVGDPENISPELLKLAVEHHNRTNRHHPEFWGKIQDVPDLYLCEMVCDWKSRSNEFGTSLIDWIDEEATVKYGFAKGDKTYKKIMKFVKLMCDKPFKKMKKN